MGYLHIPNLVNCRDIFVFKQCYAMEKIHGTSAHISWNPLDKSLIYYAGGVNWDSFRALFNDTVLRAAFEANSSIGHKTTVYGEAYGGSCQHMSKTYGKDLRFIAFEVQVGEHWLTVPAAEGFVKRLGLEFVPYELVDFDLNQLDKERDKPSRVAARLGLGEHEAEGIVVRPLLELSYTGGGRVIAKHKREGFSERASRRDVKITDDPTILEKAEEIAKEWVTPMRLQHLVGKIPPPHTRSMTSRILVDMIEDVYREASGEIVQSPATAKAIRAKTARMYLEYVDANETRT